MSLLTLVNVSLSFAGKPIFTQIGFQVEIGDKIGLVGLNGSGKTTLLRIISGMVRPDEGTVWLTKGTRLGYLAQDAQESPGGRLLQSIVDAVPGRKRLEREAIDTDKALKVATTRKAQTQLGIRMAEILQEKNHLDLEFPTHGAEKILLGLGFQTSDFERPVSELSGGWRTRAVLARLLFQKPDLLLLDEPTNHLDIQSIQWLEHFLQDFEGAMVLVSHDKDFLNRQSRRTIALEAEGLRTYTGNYDMYLKARKEEKKTLMAAARKQDQRVKEAERFIERFRYKASKARQAQSKIKLFKKMEMVQGHAQVKPVKFSFPSTPRSGRVVLTLRDIFMGFSGVSLYKNLSLTVLRGDRIAVIGPNGSGKTTLLRILAREIQPDAGGVLLGHQVQMSYFAQHHSEMLDPGKTVLQTVYEEVPDKGLGFVRGVCGAFLFSGDDVEKPVSVLSGGEKTRVSLAKLLVKPGNLMVMDEPTNHLDITSAEALIEALAGYQGTLAFVSHNQSFINRLAKKIWDVRDGKVTEYPGNLAEYFESVSQDTGASEGEENRESGHGESPPTEISSKKEKNRKQERRKQAEKRQKLHDTLKPIHSEVKRIEERIALLENRLGELEKTLAGPGFFSNEQKSVPLLNEYKAGKDELDALLLAWEKHQTKLEAVKEAFKRGEA